MDEYNSSRSSKKATSKQIPQEIIDQFIDHLYNDRETLRTCALVCRAWVTSSRYHLFGVVKIFPPKFFDQSSRYSGLIGHLDHPLCTFASSVRELNINAPTNNASGHLEPQFLYDDWLDPLIPYLSKLVSVKTLVGIEVGGWRNNHWRLLFKSTSFVIQITHLSLIYSNFVSFEQYMETIHSFPSLESLECIDNNYRLGGDYDLVDDECSLPVIFPPPPSLRILDTYFHSNGHLRQIWRWLHQCQTRLSIIKLGTNAFNYISARELSTLNQYLQFLGPSLEILQTGFETASTICEFLVDHALE